METYEHVTHTFSPVFDETSRILILGSFPSVKSREQQFYYGHPQNRFWKLLALLLSDDYPVSIPEKQAFLLRHHIAVWDVIASCDIIGSSDSSIRNVIPADIGRILSSAPISRERRDRAPPLSEIHLSGNRFSCRKTPVNQSCQCCFFHRKTAGQLECHPAVSLDL